MADCMMFPNDWHDFINDYSFIDSEHVYTNGSELIQVFRVIQLIEHLLKEQEATMVIESENMYTGLPITHCPKCGISLDKYLYGRQYEGQINYCPMCGQAVKWE